MAGTIIVDRIESDASYASSINVAAQVTFSNTVNFGVSSVAPTAGVYSPSTNNLAFTTASTERVCIDSSGNVGIGTSSPTAPLNVKVGTGNFTVGLQGAGNALLTASATMQLDAAGASSAMVFKVTGTERGRFDSSGNLQFNSGYGSVATAYGCRAWVNFNGTGTVAISASGNVTSITDNGTGDYTVNFTTAMPDANYAPTTMALSNDTSGTQGQCSIRGVSATGATTMTTTALRINTGVTSSNLFVDRALVTIAIFR